MPPECAGVLLAHHVRVSGRRILHITTFLQGGAGRVVADLACVQRAGGDAVAVACAAEEADGYTHYPAWLDRLANADVPLLRVGCTFRRSLHHLMGAVDGLERAPFVRRGIDLVHAHAAVPALVARTLRHRVPVLATMHGWNAAKSPEHAATDVAVFNRLPTVTAPSRAAADHLVSAGVDAGRVTVIPYGVAPQHAMGLSADDAALLRRWRADGLFVLACVGSVGARKRQALVLDAIATTPLRHRVACAFIGEGPDLGAYVTAARARGIAEATAFLGYRVTVTDWLRACDAAVFPSQREGLPIALLEAAALGVSVIASDIDEHRELVEPGVSGALFEAASIESLVAAIEQVVAMPAARRRALGRGARNLWGARHRPQRMHASYARLYRDHLTSPGLPLVDARAS